MGEVISINGYHAGPAACFNCLSLFVATAPLPLEECHQRRLKCSFCSKRGSVRFMNRELEGAFFVYEEYFAEPKQTDT